MQLVQTTRDALLKPLSTVAGIVERRNTLPILANVLLRREGARLAVVATDLEVQVTAHAHLENEEGPVATTVAARKLLDILRALPDSREVSLGLDGARLNIHSGKSRFALQTMDAADFPVVKQEEAWTVSFSMPQNALKNLFNMVYFAMAQQDIRYYLNGLLLVFEPGFLRAVATDAHRLAHAATPIEGVEARHDIILPRKTVLEMQRLLTDDETPVSIDVAERQIRFRFGDVELVSKLVEGKFPDFTRVIPENHAQRFQVERELLQASLQRVAILTTDKLKGVRLQVSDSQLRISSTNTEQEEAHEELDVDYEMAPLDMGFNVQYLLDMLGNVRSEQVQWAMEPNVSASALLTLPDDEHFKYVVMPMRI